MKKTRIFSALLFLFVFFLSTKVVSAAEADCTFAINPDPAVKGQALTVTLSIPNLPSGQIIQTCYNKQYPSAPCYQIWFHNQNGNLESDYVGDTQVSNYPGAKSITAKINNVKWDIAYHVEYFDGQNDKPQFCPEKIIPAQDAPIKCPGITITNQAGHTSPFAAEDTITLKYDGNGTSGFVTGTTYSISVQGSDGVSKPLHNLNANSDGTLDFSYGAKTGQMSLNNLSVDNWELHIGEASGKIYCAGTIFKIGNTPGYQTPATYQTPGTYQTPAGGGDVVDHYDVCSQIPTSAKGTGGHSLQSDCRSCVGDINTPQNIWTAVGCIPISKEGIISSLVKLGLGIAGGVALIRILAAALLFSTSQGDPKRTGEAREMLTSSVIGLLFIIFSVTILQFIGVSILHIPGF